MLKLIKGSQPSLSNANTEYQALIQSKAQAAIQLCHYIAIQDVIMVKVYKSIIQFLDNKIESL